MSGFKGTKGPWFPIEYAGKFVIQNEDYYSASNEVLESNDFSYEEAKANALLISKAPEILEMLERCAEFIKNSSFDGFDRHEMYDEIKYLIKEATTI